MQQHHTQHININKRDHQRLRKESFKSSQLGSNNDDFFLALDNFDVASDMNPTSGLIDNLDRIRRQHSY